MLQAFFTQNVCFCNSLLIWQKYKRSLTYELISRMAAIFYVNSVFSFSSFKLAWPALSFKTKRKCYSNDSILNADKKKIKKWPPISLENELVVYFSKIDIQTKWRHLRAIGLLGSVNEGRVISYAANKPVQLGQDSTCFVTYFIVDKWFIYTESRSF